MFEIIIKKEFCASHALTNRGRMIEKIHKHIWLIEVKIGGEKTDKSGCVVDFRRVDTMLNKITDKFEDQKLNSLKHFGRISPSAENIARYIFESLSRHLMNERVKLLSLTLWEDKNHGAVYLP